VGRWWWRFLERFGVPTVRRPPLVHQQLVGFGALAYLLSVTVHYALQGLEESAALAQRELQSQIAA
jgi:hypothetical protein